MIRNFLAASHKPWQLWEPVLIYEASSHFSSPYPLSRAYMIIPSYMIIDIYKIILPACLFQPTRLFFS